MFESITESNTRILTIDEKYFWDISGGQFPSLFASMQCKIFKRYLPRIHTNTLPEGLLHRSNNLLRLGSREIKCSLEIVRESGHAWNCSDFLENAQTNTTKILPKKSQSQKTNYPKDGH